MGINTLGRQLYPEAKHLLARGPAICVDTKSHMLWNFINTSVTDDNPRDVFQRISPGLKFGLLKEHKYLIHSITTSGDGKSPSPSQAFTSRASSEQAKIHLSAVFSTTQWI